MAKSTYIPIEKQEEIVRAFIKKYSKYLNYSKLEKNYAKKKGREYLGDGIEFIMDKSGFYIFSYHEDSKGRFRVSLWIESDKFGDFYPITELRWKRFIEQFEERNNVKRKNINKSR